MHGIYTYIQYIYCMYPLYILAYITISVYTVAAFYTYTYNNLQHLDDNMHLVIIVPPLTWDEHTWSQPNKSLQSP